MPERPTLHLIGGINGAGKTSFYYRILASRTPGAKFINADEIEQVLWPDEIGQHSYEAGSLAAKRREELIEARATFVSETVFSHPSKLELIVFARSLGYRVVLYHIHVSTPELASARVDTRVRRGGHDVPADTVRARHPRTLTLIEEATLLADRAFVFDNSRLGKEFTHVLTLQEGRVVTLGSYVPGWVKGVYGERLRAYLEAKRGKQ